MGADRLFAFYLLLGMPAGWFGLVMLVALLFHGQ